MAQLSNSDLSDYELLKAAGHSPQKAAEIALDAKRNDKFARQWIDIAKSSKKGEA